MEALICTQDWLKTSTTNLLFVEEDYNDMEKLETEFAKTMICACEPALSSNKKL